MPHYTMAARWSPEPPMMPQWLAPPEEPIVIKAVRSQAEVPVALAVDGPMSIPVQLAVMPVPAPANVQARAITPSVVTPPRARTPKVLPDRSETKFSDTVHKGDTAILILEQAGVDTKQAMALYREVRSVYDLRRINVGQAYHVHMDADGHIQQFTYEIDYRQRKWWW